jgi:hypothetical protein
MAEKAHITTLYNVIMAARHDIAEKIAELALSKNRSLIMTVNSLMILNCTRSYIIGLVSMKTPRYS